MIAGGMRTIAIVGVLSFALSACGDKRVRTVCSGGVDGPLVAGAALFELDDYGTTDHCDSDGVDVADASIAPATRQSFAAGAGISLALPPGAHTIVLRAFADSGGTMAIGSGCAEVQLAAGGDFCVDLTLTAPADGGGSDGGSVGGDDGGCGVVCDSIHSLGPLCSPGGCTFAGCMASYIDCNQAPPNADGCECEGSACCNGACQTKHSDGLGDSFFDCVALGTRDPVQVAKAAAAWDATGNIDAAPRLYSDNKGTVQYICDRSTVRNACACWTWNGTGQYADAGRALSTNGKPTQCFIPFGATYPAWN